jgi:hypothetical protein
MPKTSKSTQKAKSVPKDAIDTNYDGFQSGSCLQKNNKFYTTLSWRSLHHTFLLNPFEDKRKTSQLRPGSKKAMIEQMRLEDLVNINNRTVAKLKRRAERKEKKEQRRSEAKLEEEKGK